MSDFYSLMVCFGDRFINVTKDEAQFDLDNNRDTMVGAYNALTEYVKSLEYKD